MTHMTRYGRVLLGIGVLMAAGTAGIAVGKWVEETWKRPGATAEFDKVVVIGITRDEPARRRFEDKFVTNLRGKKLESITAWSIVRDLEKAPEPEVIADALLHEGVDTVITVRLVAAGDDSEAWKDGLETTTGVREYILKSLAEIDVLDEGKPIEARVGLWNRETGQQVWAARTAAHKAKKLRKNVNAIVQEVLDDLAHDQIF